MTSIGLISDTHGIFSPEFREFLEPCDQIWHAGDFGGGMGTARSIAEIRPLIGVHGNCDGTDIRYDYPSYQFFTCEDMTVLMTHIGGYPGHYDLRARALIEQFRPRIFVCGHSHILRVIYDDKYGMLTLNPGACGLQGWQTIRTALRFKIDGDEVKDMEILKVPRSSH